MRLRFTRPALDDLSDIAAYLKARNPHAAVRVRNAIEESIAHLAAFPRAGRAQTTEGVRKLVTRKYPYLVYYTLDDAAAEVVILNIKHPARKRDHDDS